MLCKRLRSRRASPLTRKIKHILLHDGADKLEWEKKRSYFARHYQQQHHQHHCRVAEDCVCGADGPSLFVRKELGSHVYFCPRPCLSTFRWARLATHRRGEPHSVYHARPCDHRMCVTAANETGLSPLARTCSRTWTFRRRLHIWALRSLCLTPFTSENDDTKNWQ